MEGPSWTDVSAVLSGLSPTRGASPAALVARRRAGDSPDVSRKAERETLGHEELELQRSLVKAAAAEARVEVLDLRQRLEARDRELESLRSSRVTGMGDRPPSPSGGSGEAIREAEARLLRAAHDLREEFRAPSEATADASNPMLRRALEVARGQTRAQRAAALAAQAEAESRCSEAQRGLRTAREEANDLRRRLRALEEDGRSREEALQALSSEARASDTAQAARVQELEEALTQAQEELINGKSLLESALDTARADAKRLDRDLERERVEKQRLSQEAARAQEEVESVRAERLQGEAATARLREELAEARVEAKRLAAEHMTVRNVLEKKLAEAEEETRVKVEAKAQELLRAQKETQQMRAEVGQAQVQAQEETRQAQAQLERARAEAQEASRRQAEAYAQGLERVQTEARKRVQQARVGLQQSEAKAKEAVQLQGEVLRLQLEQDKAERAAGRLREDLDRGRAAAEEGLERANAKAEESRAQVAKLVEDLEVSRAEIKRLQAQNMSQRYKVTKLEDLERLQAQAHAEALEKVQSDAWEEAEAASRQKDEVHAQHIEHVLAGAREEARAERRLLEKALTKVEEEAQAERAQLQEALEQAAVASRQDAERHAQELDAARRDIQQERVVLRAALAEREAQLEEQLSESRREALVEAETQAAAADKTRSDLQQKTKTLAALLKEAEASRSELQADHMKLREASDSEREALKEQIEDQGQKVRGLEVALAELEAALGEQLRDALAEKAHVQAEAEAQEAELRTKVVDLELQLKSESIEQESMVRELRDATTAQAIDYENQVASLEESLRESLRTLKAEIGERDILILQLKGEGQAREVTLQETLQTLDRERKAKSEVEAAARSAEAEAIENRAKNDRYVAELRQQINAQALEHENHEAEMDEALAGALARAREQEDSLTRQLQEAQRELETLVKVQSDTADELEALCQSKEGLGQALSDAHRELAVLRSQDVELRSRMKKEAQESLKCELELEALQGQLQSSRENVSELMEANIKLEEKLFEAEKAVLSGKELSPEATGVGSHGAQMLLQLEKVKKLLDEKNLKAEDAEGQMQRLAQLGREVAETLRESQGAGPGAEATEPYEIKDTESIAAETRAIWADASHSEEIAALRSEIDSRKDQMIRLEANCEKMRGELEEHRSELFVSQSAQDQSEKENALLLSEIELSKKAVQSLSKEKEDLKTECRGFELQASELRAKLESNTAEVQRLNNVISYMEGEQAEISEHVADLAALGLDEDEGGRPDTELQQDGTAPSGLENEDLLADSKEDRSLDKMLLEPMQAMLAEVVALRAQCEEQAALLDTSRHEASKAATVQAEVNIQLDTLLAENAQLLRAKTDLERQNEALNQACALGDTVFSWESDDTGSESREAFGRTPSAGDLRGKWLRRLVSLPALVVLPVLAAGRLLDPQTRPGVPRGGQRTRAAAGEPAFVEEHWER